MLAVLKKGKTIRGIRGIEVRQNRNTLLVNLWRRKKVLIDLFLVAVGKFKNNGKQSIDSI